jgi:hemerythrin-like domain-containing protein
MTRRRLERGQLTGIPDMSEHGLPETLPGFDDPLAMLRACHQKMLMHCDLLDTVIMQARSGELDDAARKAAQDITRYFSSSAPLHHRDEEQDLFPRINRQSLRIAELVHGLKREHEELDSLWERLAPQLRRITGEGFSDAFQMAAARFCELSRQHINRENMELLPLLASSLSREELGYIGESMAQRRGVQFSAK